MQFRPTSRSERALTLMEVLVVIVGLLFLGVLLVYFVATIQNPYEQIARRDCANKLKQLGLAYRIFADDNDDKYPFFVTYSVAFGNDTQAWLHFQAMSNELGSARLLICPSDRERLTNLMSDFGDGIYATPTSLSTWSNAAVSYAASLDADRAHPNAILTSDRHLQNTSSNLVGRLYLARSNATSAAWATSQHNGAGNYARSDGSVQMADSKILTDQIRRQGIATNRLLLPLLP